MTLGGHLAEFGIIITQKLSPVGKLVAAEEDQSNNLPDLVRTIMDVLIDTMETLNDRIAVLNFEMVKAVWK